MEIFNDPTYMEGALDPEVWAALAQTGAMPAQSAAWSGLRAVPTDEHSRAAERPLGRRFASGNEGHE